ncbi:hypothetical protein CAPN001_13520 [Capnocytophaga stomatis]|uniref:hypothetical protein n=1 Tax=Capnocytophaga stomatis TaxID=1848904 RepID=UPI0019519309|nr:hypothetical protein [Capnocytophaga stomatis]GIJ94021.1 hypothetical protein CAPN002_12390 [Capnocytophaga stomatis]GIJ96783.1 hypothetical protein CAPN001_13520 [Capnocytophaga stomatis]GIM48589.1 hypothetical protein CAPN003_00410 [Capnocytophaga stomatis]
MNIFSSVVDLGVNIEDFPAIDVDIYGNYIAFDGKNSVNINGMMIPLEEEFKIKFPLVQMLDNNSFLLADMRSVSTNAFIFSINGVLQRSFYVGDAIENITFNEGKIIVSYFDEGVFGNPPSTEGLAVFDMEGKQLFGVNSSFGYEYICDCYALCKLGEHSVLFFAYTEFELAQLNLKNFQIQRTKIPEVLAGASAMVSDNETIVFFAPYEHKNTLFRYNLYSKKLQKLGKIDFSIIKGIENGLFLAIKDKHFHIIGL